MSLPTLVPSCTTVGAVLSIERIDNSHPLKGVLARMVAFSRDLSADTPLRARTPGACFGICPPRIPLSGLLRGEEPYKFDWGAETVAKCRLILERSLTLDHAVRAEF